MNEYGVLSIFGEKGGERVAKMMKLRQIARKKLREERGASITMALLLFLACAVIGAVVLTAGTASAGRLSGMAETDRRYYIVASAAELVAKELDGRSVIYEETDAGGETTLVVDGVTIPESPAVGDLPLLTAQAVHYARREQGMTETMELVFPALAEYDYPETTVYLTSKLDEKDRLCIELSDEGGFTLTLTMTPATVHLGTWEETDDKGMITSTTEITKISWSVSDIE